MPNTRNLPWAAALVVAAALCCAEAGGAPLERVSVSSDEVEGNGKSYYPSVSDNGRFVAFCSFADNLVPGDTNGVEDMFVRDRLNGATERISVSSSEVQGNAASCGARLGIISADGRFVAFSSSATSLVAGDNNGAEDAFIRDRQTGITERVSVDSAERQLNEGGKAASLSADGRFVVFLGEKGMAIRDRKLGTTERSGTGGVLSANRRFAAAFRYGTDGHDDWREIWLQDRLNGTNESLGCCISISWNPDLSFSADGRFVSVYDYYIEPAVLDRKSGVRLSVDEGIEFLTTFTQILSANGRFVVFGGLDASDPPGNVLHNVFVRDLLARTTEKLTNDPSTKPTFGGGIFSISADGSFVAFTSDADSLVPGDTNNDFNVFVSDFVREPRELPEGRNDLVVASSGGDGVQQLLNNQGWVKIDNASASILAAGDLDGSIKDEVIAGFPGRGLLARDNKAGVWQKLHDAVPQRLVVGDFDGNGLDDLAADFGAEGLWVRVNRKPWAQVHASTTKGLKAGDLDGDGKDELIATFGRDGLWARYNNSTWVKLQPGSPVRLATGDLDGNGQDELIAEFGTAIFALYNNERPFVRLPNGPTQGLATGDLDGDGRDEFLADLGSRGLWAYYNNSAPWKKLDPRSPASLLATDLDQDGKEDVVAAFGSEGLQVRYNNAGAFVRINLTPAVRAVAAGGFN